MQDHLRQISKTARMAAQRSDWATTQRCSEEILRLNEHSAEGHFLKGLVEKVSARPRLAIEEFELALELDEGRYDAAIELASQYSTSIDFEEAEQLLDKYVSKLDNSPRYLDMAATSYTTMGLPEKGWPLYLKANALQPNISLFQANMAACAVYLGKTVEAKEIYEQLLKQFPHHQRNHYQYSRVEPATDSNHINQMLESLKTTNLAPDQNIFMYYALGKEYEDLEQWDQAFKYYEMAGNAVDTVSDYDIEADEMLINTIINACSSDWLTDNSNQQPVIQHEKTPVFILGLPRTGTTLTERILSSHSKVSTAGETQFLEIVLRAASGIESVEKMNIDMVNALANKDMQAIGTEYLQKINYMLDEKPMFIDKLPYNFLYIGFIAKAFPEARIICLKRNPMDTCFAMYKQAFTWTYKFSYTQEDLGRYYIAYNRMLNHWKEVLGNRLIEVEYEALVTDQEQQTRLLLENAGLQFEPACLNFEENTAASMTASSVQIREKVHNRSVAKWKKFADQLEPLRQQLESAGIETG